MKPQSILAGAGALLLLLAAGLFLARPDAARPAIQSETTTAASARHPSKGSAAKLEQIRLPGSLRTVPDQFPRETARLTEDLLARLKLCDPAQRAAEIARFVAEQDTAGLEDMLVADALADTKSGPALPEDVSQAMLRRVAREDAAWTADYLQILPADTFRGELLGTTMVEWGKSDLPTAVEWAQKLTDPSLQETALVHLSYRWYEQNPEEALAFAALHPTEHRQLLTTLVGQWSREQPEAAAAWAAGFSQEPAMTNVAASAVAAWAQQDDLAAAEFVLKLPDGPLRQEAAISVMSALARQDPATGALWANAFPPGPNRDYAIENLTYSWAASDPTAAFAWSNRLAAAERDVAIFAGTGGLIETRPEVAATWVNAIQDEARRIQQSERLAQRWLQVDRWSAEFWIRNSLLPPETKQRLLASTAPGG
jgi:hypothetical protein